MKLNSLIQPLLPVIFLPLNLLLSEVDSKPAQPPTPPDYPVLPFTPLKVPDPRSSENGLLVDSFGAVGDGKADDLAAIRRATGVALKKKLPLLFSPGKQYRVGDDEHTYYLFDLINAEGLIVDGQGATLILHQDMEFCRLVGCRQMEFRNLQIDSIPRSVQGTLALEKVVRKGEIFETTVTLDGDSDLFLAENYLGPTSKKGTSIFIFDPKNMICLTTMRLTELKIIDRKTKTCQITALTGDERPVEIHPGYKIALLPRLNLDKKDLDGKSAGDRSGVLCIRCDQIVFRSLNISDLGPLKAQACGQMVWEKVVGFPPPNRLCGGTCHWHFNNPGPMLFQNCDLRGNSDDTFSTVCRSLNIQSRVDERTLILSQPADFLPGDLVTFTADLTGEFIVKPAAKYEAEGNKSQRRLVELNTSPDWIGEATVEKAEPMGGDPDPNTRSHWRCDLWKVTFKKPLAFLTTYTNQDLKFQVRAIPWRSLHGNGVTVRDCKFLSHFRNAITGGPINILYQGVTILSTGSVGSYTGNIFNGLGPRNATWQDCKIIDTVNHAIAWSVSGNTGWWSKNIEIKGCTIKSSQIYKGAIFVAGLSHVRIENNTIEVSSPGGMQCVIEAGKNRSGVGDDIVIRNNKIVLDHLGGKIGSAVINLLGSNLNVNQDLETSNTITAPAGIPHFQMNR